MAVSTDDELVEAFRAGDVAAFRQLVDRYHESIFDFVSRVVGDLDAAAGVTTAVFSEPLSASPASVRSQLFRRARLAAVVIDPSDRPSEWGEITVPPGTDSADASAASEQAQRVWAAASRLDSQVYSVFDLDTKRGLSGDELAAVLGVSRGHAASAAARARDSVRSSVAADLLLAHGGCADLAALAGERSAVAHHVVRCDDCQTARGALTLPGFVMPIFKPIPPPSGIAEVLGALDVSPLARPKTSGRRVAAAGVIVAAVGLVAVAAVALPRVSLGTAAAPSDLGTIATSTTQLVTTTSEPASTPSAPSIPSPGSTSTSRPARVAPANTTSTSLPFIVGTLGPTSTTTSTTSSTTPTTSATSGSAVVGTTTAPPAATSTTTTAPPTTTTSTTTTTTSTTTTTTTAAPNASPDTSIDWPMSNAMFCEGRSVKFNGSATDSDGDVITSYSWSSSIDGAFASTELADVVVSVGTHTITFSATDARGATGSSSVSITVQPDSAAQC